MWGRGNRVLTRTTRATVVPAKAGIQEILREKTEPATERSGFRLSPERRVYGAIALSAGWLLLTGIAGRATMAV